MNFSDLTPYEQDVVMDCFKTVLSGKFTWPEEVSLLIDIEVEELEEIAKRWPHLDKNNPADALGISGSLAQCINDVPDHHWENWIRASKDEVQVLSTKFLRVVDWQKVARQRRPHLFAD